MGDVRIEINHEGFKELALGPGMRAAVLAEAEKARLIAEGLSADFTKSGDYESSFNTFTETVPLGAEYPHLAVGGILKNDSEHAAAVEWGNEETGGKYGGQAHHVLGRTLDVMDRG